MSFRCTTFILRVGTESVAATIRMHVEDEIVQTTAGQVNAQGQVLFAPEWGARFYYTLGVPRTKATRPAPSGGGSISNNFSVEWTAPMIFPGTPPTPTDVNFAPSAPAGEADTRIGPSDEQEAAIGGEAPVFRAGVVGTYDWIGRICFFQPEPT